MREIITTTGASVFTACVLIAQAAFGGSAPATATGQGALQAASPVAVAAR